MTTAQLQAVKTDITVTHASTVYQGQTLLQHWNNNATQLLADYYNTTASPQLDLWRPNVPTSDACSQIVMSDFITLTTAKQNGWFVMTQPSYIDATNSLVRTNFTTIFGSPSTTLTNLIALAKKAATNFESLFTTSNVSTVFGQIISSQDVYQAKFV